MPIQRRRGVPGGLILFVLGTWAALIPFVGPYFGYGFTPDDTWHWTTDRLWLDVLPGAAAALGGLILVRGTTRMGASLGAGLALLGGLWLVAGVVTSDLWTNAETSAVGFPLGDGDLRHTLEWLGVYFGVGGLITTFAAYEMGFLAALPLGTAPAAPATAVSSPPVPPEQVPRRRWLGRWRRSPARPTA
jgi:hypothetical protein